MARKSRHLTIIALAVTLLLTACGSTSGQSRTTRIKSDDEPGSLTIRIGYQKYGTMNILKADGSLDRRLLEHGIKIEWTEFPGGPQLLEALNAGSIDFGHTGEAPPIFAKPPVHRSSTWPTNRQAPRVKASSYLRIPISLQSKISRAKKSH